VKLYSALLFLSCIAILGCGGSGPNEVIGTNDAAGIAAYEKLMAEQQMSPEEVLKVEAEMKESSKKK
jgi:hypothetical protein